MCSFGGSTPKYVGTGSKNIKPPKAYADSLREEEKCQVPWMGISFDSIRLTRTGSANVQVHNALIGIVACGSGTCSRNCRHYREPSRQPIDDLINDSRTVAPFFEWGNTDCVRLGLTVVKSETLLPWIMNRVGASILRQTPGERGSGVRNGHNHDGMAEWEIASGCE